MDHRYPWRIQCRWWGIVLIHWHNMWNLIFIRFRKNHAHMYHLNNHTWLEEYCFLDFSCVFLASSRNAFISSNICLFSARTRLISSCILLSTSRWAIVFSSSEARMLVNSERKDANSAIMERMKLSDIDICPCVMKYSKQTEVGKRYPNIEHQFFKFTYLKGWFGPRLGWCQGLLLRMKCFVLWWMGLGPHWLTSWVPLGLDCIILTMHNTVVLNFVPLRCSVLRKLILPTLTAFHW